MTQPAQRHYVESIPSSRQLTFDVGRLSQRKHHVFAFLEADVSEALERLEHLKERGSTDVSFTSWFIKCVADAVSEHPHVHAARKGNRRLLVFHEVDVSTLVEKEVHGKKVPLPVLIRDVGKKSVRDIYAEIRKARELSVVDESGYVLNGGQSRFAMRLFTSLPQWLRLLLWNVILRNPLRQKQMMGTVVVTSVGMMGRTGWVVPSSMFPLAIALGSIVQKPGVHLGQIAVRSYLPVTVVLDHDVVDGAPAARFASRLVELVEGSHLLPNGEE
ncbi:MAG: hypothetical protein A2X97_12430 [Bdellovibrionales bacterium GWA1_52_35]|nr:MAG: hypothetical protein A2X97_12430 [Bdellovibrionales bacterium GWA1_52_35]